jgi:hypothetical protein
MTKLTEFIKSRNWWKLGFFALLFLFEGAREWAVVVSNTPVTLGSSAFVARYGDYVTASGQWKRLDGGERLEPSYIKIDCWESEKRCILASISAHGNFITDPDISRFSANFTADSVTYRDEAPVCVTYEVRIDLRLQKVFATRVTKGAAPTDLCAHYEKRMELTLGNGFEMYDATKGHFLPVLSAVWLLLGK